MKADGGGYEQMPVVEQANADRVAAHMNLLNGQSRFPAWQPPTFSILAFAFVVSVRRCLFSAFLFANSWQSQVIVIVIRNHTSQFVFRQALGMMSIQFIGFDVGHVEIGERPCKSKSGIHFDLSGRRLLCGAVALRGRIGADAISSGPP